MKLTITKAYIWDVEPNKGYKWQSDGDVDGRAVSMSFHDYDLDIDNTGELNVEAEDDNDAEAIKVWVGDNGISSLTIEGVIHLEPKPAAQPTPVAKGRKLGF